MNEPPFTLRIHVEGDQDMDWMVQPEEVTFQQTLEVISQLIQNTSVTAFEYEDAEGDRVTVRGDEEMKSMFSDYFYELSEEDRTRGLFPPLIIYPKLGKTPQNRNIHGLKVHVKSGKQESTVDQEMPTAVTVGDDKQCVNETNSTIQQILASGHIKAEDLEHQDVLGFGNGGQVNKTIHKPTKSLMAVKMIKLDLTPIVQKQILSEMENLHKCNNSSSIIAFFGAFFNQNVISICTEYMDGGSLNNYMPIPEHILSAMSAHIIDGLLYMWNLKILHRDIKPSNILVNTAGQVKLCDFGVSTQLVKSIATTFVGTNVYMAPERIQGNQYGIPAEIWSLGVSLFELVTGKLPFPTFRPDMTPFELMGCIISEAPMLLPQENFSANFVHFVNLCLQKNLQQRLTVAHLVSHPYTKLNEGGNIQLVSEWIRQYIAERGTSKS